MINSTSQKLRTNGFSSISPSLYLQPNGSPEKWPNTDDTKLNNYTRDETRQDEKDDENDANSCPNAEKNDKKTTTKHYFYHRWRRMQLRSGQLEDTREGGRKVKAAGAGQGQVNSWSRSTWRGRRSTRCYFPRWLRFVEQNDENANDIRTHARPGKKAKVRL